MADDPIYIRIHSAPPVLPSSDGIGKEQQQLAEDTDGEARRIIAIVCLVVAVLIAVVTIACLIPNGTSPARRAPGNATVAVLFKS